MVEYFAHNEKVQVRSLLDPFAILLFPFPRPFGETGSHVGLKIQSVLGPGSSPGMGIFIFSLYFSLGNSAVRVFA
jgi:hypothetical protein